MKPPFRFHPATGNYTAIDYTRSVRAEDLSEKAAQLAKELTELHATFAPQTGAFYFLMDRSPSFPLGSIDCIRFHDNLRIGTILPSPDASSYSVQWSLP